MEGKVHCIFCGEELEPTPDPKWVCPGCRACFSVEQDETGCVVRMNVQGCGTPDCCRQDGQHPIG